MQFVNALLDPSKKAKKGDDASDKHTNEGVIIHENWDGAGAVHGVTLWDGGLALAKFFAWRDAHGISVRGRKVLELGAGTGVVGLMLAKLGAAVTLTDNEPEVLDLMHVNVIKNNLECGGNASVRHLDWADKLTYLTDCEFDMVVAADVLYEGYGGPVLAAALDAHMPTGSSTEAFFAFRRRTEAPLSFFATMSGLGFTLERLEDVEGQAVGDSHGTANSVYDDSRFVMLPADRATEAVQEACFAPGRSIQLFRFRRPVRAAPSGTLHPARGGGDSDSAHAEEVLPPAPTIWIVAEALGRNGLLVRTGCQLTAPADGYLATGARVAEVELVGNRLSFRKVSGDGTSRGWVSLTFKGRSLLSRE